MAQDALHSFWLDLRLIHKPARKRVPQVVKAEALAWFNLDTCLDGCRPEMVGNEYGWGDGHEANITIATVSPDFRTAIIQQFGLNLQVELAKDRTLEVGYVGTRGTHLLRFGGPRSRR